MMSSRQPPWKVSPSTPSSGIPAHGWFWPWLALWCGVGWVAMADGGEVAGPVSRPRTEYQILSRFPPGRLAAVTAGDWPDSKGFTGGNRTLGHWLEAGPQRGSCRAVIASVVAGNLGAADDAWRGIETAFAHQREDGGFEAEIRPNGKSARPLAAAVETSFFFLQELGRAILVIRQSPHSEHFRQRLVALEPKLRRACAFMDSGYDTILPHHGHAVNRVLIAAKAFGTCGLVLDDPSLVEKARRLVAFALTRRDEVGVFVEKGGRDSSYNAVSILFGQVLALHLPLSEFEAALPAAVAWQVSRVAESGEVEVAGNTRTGVGLEPGYDGQPKRVNYNEVIQALTIYGLAHDDRRALEAADRVFAWSRRPPAAASDASVVRVRATSVEKWGMYEIVLRGPSTGNPFVDVRWSARFESGPHRVEVPGFYDGEGVYRARFMPGETGDWTYVTHGNIPELDGHRGGMTVTPPGLGNHGPVRVAHTFHFAYADGTPYRQIGTTCYAWTHQSEALQEQTLATLAGGPFDKIRFCVFPKRYSWNTNEPALYPFEGAPGRFDFTRFRPEFFRHFEGRVLDLQRLGIEADIILFHPYDRGAWGFDRLTAEQDDRYLRYVVARLAAFRNVWWSLANEYDFMKEKTEADWMRIGEEVARQDPYGHLLGIHNGTRIFDHTLPWITHASLQNGSAVEDAGRAVLYRDVYRKPIVFDEVKYEGDIPRRWGQLSGEEMVHRFWEGTIAGTYVGHGETYLSPDDVLWWSKGGILRGRSPERLAFLRRVLSDAPAEGIEPLDKWQNPEYGGRAPDYFLVYLGTRAPTNWTFRLPRFAEGPESVRGEGLVYRAEILDTWNMTITSVPGTFTLAGVVDYFHADRDGRSIALPGRPFMAIRIRRVP